MSGFDSISSLFKNGSGKDDSAPSQLLKKQQEIKNKEIEKKTQAQAQTLGLSYVNLFGFPIDHEAILMIPEDQAIKNKVVCFFYDGENIKVASSQPQRPEVQTIIDELNRNYFTKSTLFLISNESLKEALAVYKIIPKSKKITKGVEISQEDLARFKDAIVDYKNLNDKIKEVNISDIVTLLLATALKTGSSDIHIESEANNIIVRLRIDGVLQEAATIEKDKWKKIVSRMKILAGVKINIDDKPQDGRYSVFLKDERIDVRSSFLPTAFGESVVMRLLKSSSVGLSYDDLGLSPSAYKILKKEMEKPNGLILTTGPTGSGKTTTLYAILNQLNQPGTKIITLEDPIEYQLKGINQSQIDSKKGYTFASGLRSILRQDPDIVMVGEIRDLETAEIAIQASLTGHLVLSTLHTNDAAGVIPRLTDMGIKPYLLLPSINAVVGQRLVRKLCPHCQQVQNLNPDEEEQVKKILAVVSPKAEIDIPSSLSTFYQAGPGCEQCNGIGYKGRIGIYEIFTMNDKLKQLTMDNAPSFKILKEAIESGMITMLQDGVLKAIKGQTSLEEVYRVIGNFDYVDELYNVAISQTISRGLSLTADEMSQAAANLSDWPSIDKKLKEVPAKKLISSILALALEARAGDIHIEPSETNVKVRLRIDGFLHDIVDLPKNSFLPLLGEIKTISGFATNVKRATLDGRFSIFLPEKRKLDSRVSIISGGFGETIVIRLLNDEGQNLNLKRLGFSKLALPLVEKMIKKTKGIILTTGPTGSGKTTTLYSLLKEVNTTDTKIITIEDPIEYQIEGVIQTQVDSEAGYTFASAMRSLLRQNPNIMMIGEVRDTETAQTALEAASTGHLVLSTIHTNSAAGAVSRFKSLGLDRQLLANTLTGSIGQRLVRKLCPYCKEEAVWATEEIERAKEILSSIKNKDFVPPSELKFYRSRGCPRCQHIGYQGLLGLYEVLENSPAISKTIADENSSDQLIEKTALDGGMISLLQDGLLKALDGLTSLEEVYRVIK